MPIKITRRGLLKGLAAGGAACALGNVSPDAYAASAISRGITVLKGDETTNSIFYRLTVKRQKVAFGNRTHKAITINDAFPGPVIRLKEGKKAVIEVKNDLEESTSVHWHGILLPYKMDGVPGVVFPGIPSGKSFTYAFKVRQAGTYWYHSHTGLQEQLGHYGPLICQPRNGEPHHYHREHIIILSDWTFEDPDDVLMHLKKWEGYYNYQKRTLSDLAKDISHKGFLGTLQDRLMWAQMRMNPRDIADVTGATYTYLLNGMTPEENHCLLFSPGERVRLRIINASAATYFDFRIPGLQMTVIQADGQDVAPVTVDEFRIAVAETYDVIVEPRSSKPYGIFAETMDRSGFAFASLTPKPGLFATPPERRPPLERKMAGMNMDFMGTRTSKKHMEHDIGPCSVEATNFPFGPDAAMVVKKPRSMIDMPGAGLDGSKRKILTYADLKAQDSYEPKVPDRKIEIHLTGNMERFIWKMWAWEKGEWSSDFSHLIRFNLGQRIRLVFVNHTMMDHPIHLHGMWMRLLNGSTAHAPRKHTVNIKPSEKLCVDVDADAFGNWAFHCHILYHMHTGMFRVVQAC